MDEVVELADAFCELDCDFRVVRVNRRQEEISRLPRSQTIGRVHWEIWPESKKDPYWSEFRRCMSERVPVEFESFFPPLDMWVHVIAHPTSTGGIVIFFRDVTARRRSEDALRESEERARQRTNELQTVLDTVPAAVWITRDPRGDHIEANRFGAELLRRPSRTNVSLTGEEGPELGFVVKRDGKPVQPEEHPVQKTARTGLAVRSFEEDVVFSDGTVRHIFGSVSPILDPTGKPAGAVGAFLDITDRKRAELELKRAYERLRLAKEAAGIGIHDYDDSTDTIEWDQRMRELWGFSADEPVTYEAFLAGVVPEDRGAVQAAVDTALDPGGNGNYRAEFRVRHRDTGAERWVAATGRVYFADGRPTRLVGMVFDVTSRRQVEEVIRFAQDRLVETLRFAGAGTWEWNIRTDAFAWSRETYDLLGVRPDEPPNRELFERIVNRTDWNEVVADLKRVVDGGSDEYRHEFRIAHPLRGERWILGVGRINRETGRLRGLNLDVTERKQAEQLLQESQNRLSLALAAGRVGIWDWSIDSGTEQWSPETYEIMGRTEGEFDGTPQAFFELIHPEDRAEVHERVRAALEKDTPYTHQFRILLPDGAERWVANMGRVVRDSEGHALRMIGTVRDISEERALEAALRATDRRKTEFIAVLSHELRNPLAPIRNALHVLNRAPAESDAAQRANEVLHRQTQQLSRLVNDLLDISRITYGKIELTLARLDARIIVSRAFEDAQPEFEQHQVKLVMAEEDEPLWVDADAARLMQMIGNLLHNALKFTPPGGRVDVDARRHGDVVRICVRDTGVGLEPEDIERIFDPFVQTGREATRIGGLGLGLALVRELATSHAGTIRAESHGRGTGAEFIVELPLAEAPRDEDRPLEAAPSAPRLKVVVVEDNEDAALTLADLLDQAGHRVTTAATGRAGLDSIAKERPDVVICDIGLPDMSGHDLIRTVRSLNGGHRVFAIALTGYAQPEDREQALLAGFDAHLAKPADLNQLDKLLADSALSSSSVRNDPGHEKLLRRDQRTQ